MYQAIITTYASQLVMRGVRLTEVKELLGHASSTRGYGHLSPDARRSAIALLDDAPQGYKVRLN